VIAVLRATGVRAGEIAGIRCCPDDPGRSDVDLQNRTIRVRGKGRRERVVPIGRDAARALDRYLRARSRHAQAWRPQLWLGVNNRGPVMMRNLILGYESRAWPQWADVLGLNRLATTCRRPAPSW
jgi:site-specific recombinase XerD